jgi:hypothetical protein
MTMALFTASFFAFAFGFMTNGYLETENGYGMSNRLWICVWWSGSLAFMEEISCI